MFVAQSAPNPIAGGAFGSLPTTDEAVEMDYSPSSITTPTTLNGEGLSPMSPVSIKKETSGTSQGSDRVFKTKQKRNKPTLSCLYVAHLSPPCVYRGQTLTSSEANASSERRNAIVADPV